MNERDAAAGEDGPVFSLVLATVDRTHEVERLLESLAQQDDQRFEVLLVDQNADDRLVGVVREAELSVPVIHLRSPRGLSRARNLALPHARGRIVAFPDDDCWYPPDLLGRVSLAIDTEGLDGLTVRAALVGEGSPFGAIRTGRDAEWLDRSTAWARAISYTMFLRGHVVRQVGRFDEALGVGADTPWWSGEDSDYVLRALAVGFRVRYEPCLEVFHPLPPRGEELLRRSYCYGLGMGRVWRKHRHPVRLVLRGIVRPMGGAVLCAVRRDHEGVRFYVNSVRGRFKGWRAPLKDVPHPRSVTNGGDRLP